MSLLRYGLTPLLIGVATLSAAAPPGESAGVPADEALARLMRGNKRFVRDESKHPHESRDYRASLAKAQHPFATVLACSDSRVTPALIFDQGVGDLFVIRVAGAVVDEDVAGSLEYAVDHLGTKLLLVMGHKSCGAVTAAYHTFVAHDLKEREPHEIESLLLRIEPAFKDVDTDLPVDKQINTAIENNVRVAVENLRRFVDVRQACDSGRLVIRGAMYGLRTGEVELLSVE
ncbi:Carbonic anhydrase 2 [Planctomycetes bacterium MalM25]|nr:Carbonic anhydrase 2 [Planctomycetes bacterium MalM25]